MKKFKNTLYSLLRKSERYTKTDMVYLTRGGFWATVGQVTVSLATFLMAIAFAYFLTKETYGEYKYVLSVASLLVGTLTLSGLGVSVTQSVARGFEGTMKFAFWENLRWSIIFLISAAGLSLYYFIQGNTSLAVAMLIIALLSPILNSTNLYNSYLVAKKDFRRQAIYYTIIGNLFPYICLLIVLVSTPSPLLLIATYFVSNTLIGVVLYFHITRIYKPNNGVDNESLTYGKHLSVMNIFTTIAANIDQILVFHYIGAAELAIYHFATAIPDQAKGFLKGLDNMIFPKFSERSDKEIRGSMNHKFTILAVVGISVSLIYLAISPYIFHTFFPQYIDSIKYSQIYGLSLIAMIVALPASNYLKAKKKIEIQYYTSILGSITQITLVVIGVIYWGLWGLIMARVIMRFFGNAVTIIIYNYSTEKAD